jgi:hypothetical protein
MGATMLIGGFLLAIVGIAALSKAVACIVAGSLMFVAGGMEYRRTRRRQPNGTGEVSYERQRRQQLHDQKSRHTVSE